MYLSSDNYLLNATDIYNCFIVEVTNTLAIDLRAREWCKLPYKGHPNGCPNWNRNPKCPPQIPLVSDIFDLLKPHWFAVVAFNLARHRENMAQKHPNWSERQCNCCLYWQNSVRKQLKKLCQEVSTNNNDSIYTLIPEAMGINVFKTAHRNGIILKRNPKDLVIKLALIGFQNNNVNDAIANERTDYCCIK